MNKPSWIYDVDNSGIIKDKKLYEVPTDIEKYYAKNVAEQIVDEYIKIIQ